MMLVCPWFQRKIVVEEGSITTLVMEEPNLFRKFVEDLTKQTEGVDGEIVCSVDYVPKDAKQLVEVIGQFAPFEINKKQLLNKIVAQMEKTALNAGHYAKARALLQQIEQFMEEIAFDYNCDLIYEKIDIGSIIKAVGIRLADDYGHPLERILDYMTLVREFEKNKMFVMINMRSYFDDEAMKQFAKNYAPDVEVLKPEMLRNTIIEEFRNVLEVYTWKENIQE